MELVSSDVREQIDQVFRNLLAVAQAAGGDFGDVVKLNVYLTDLADFPVVNEVMAGTSTSPTRPGPRSGRLAAEGGQGGDGGGAGHGRLRRMHR